MPYEITRIEGELVTLRLQGLLHADEQQAVQKVLAELIDRQGSARLLVIGQGFQGWADREDWGDMSFLMEYGDAVKKIAIIGDERWKDDAFAFSSKGFRETEIEFFTANQREKAEQWVNL